MSSSSTIKIKPQPGSAPIQTLIPSKRRKLSFCVESIDAGHYGTTRCALVSDATQAIRRHNALIPFFRVDGRNSPGVPISHRPVAAYDLGKISVQL